MEQILICVFKIQNQMFLDYYLADALLYCFELVIIVEFSLNEAEIVQIVALYFECG